MNKKGTLIYKSRFPFIGLFFRCFVSAFAVSVYYSLYSSILSGILFIASGLAIASVFTTVRIYTDRIIINKPALPFFKAHVFSKNDLIYAGFVFGFQGVPKFEIKTAKKTKSFFQCFEINERDRIVNAIELIGIKSYRL